MKMKQIECSETSAYKIQTSGNYPEENIQHTVDVSERKWLQGKIMYVSLQGDQTCWNAMCKFVANFYLLLTARLDIIVLKKTNLMHNLFLVYFVNIYMFRAYLGPSSGGKTVCIQQLVLLTQPGKQAVI